MDEPLWQRLRDDSIAVPGRTTIHLAEHRMIYEAIAEGDADAARALRGPAHPPRAQVHDARLKGITALPRHHPRRHHPVRRLRRRSTSPRSRATSPRCSTPACTASSPPARWARRAASRRAERRTVVARGRARGRRPRAGDRRRVRGHARRGDRARRRRRRRRRDALMMLPPLGYRADAREIEAHYRAVAEAAGLPLMAYNNPEASGIDMRAELIARAVRGDRRASSRSRSARATRGGSRRCSTPRRSSRCSWAATTGRSRASARARPAG